jgi:DNA-directed RNA polymerase subunit beta
MSWRRRFEEGHRFCRYQAQLAVGDKMPAATATKALSPRSCLRGYAFPGGRHTVELVLNPLGVPSRMNVGQILETHLGWAAKVLGLYVATPVSTASEARSRRCRKAGLPEDGKVHVYDGFTGKKFDQKVTVGYIYMMKLIHLVDEKIMRVPSVRILS